MAKLVGIRIAQSAALAACAACGGQAGDLGLDAAVVAIDAAPSGLDAAPPDPSDLVFDPDRIHEVLGNLLDNALRHTPPGGTVEVAARLGADKANPAAVIEVSDSGAGFPEQKSERIFGRFEKATGSPGSGLGLTLARAIVEAHHGTLTAHSDGLGQGALFTVTIPAGAARPHRARPTNR